MGRSKADLPWGDRTLLQHVVERLSQAAVRSVVVVAAPDQPLPILATEVLVARDRTPGNGPLEGVVAGLQALPMDCGAAYVTSCDAPWVEPSVVRHLVSLLEQHQAVVPCDGDMVYPLAAIYTRDVVATAQANLDEGRRSLRELVQSIRARKVDVELLRVFDPQLLTLVNLNTPEEYEAALRLWHGPPS
jgi:molybdopterin-guanine dinucleotide biosynthesis protein A